MATYTAKNNSTIMVYPNGVINWYSVNFDVLLHYLPNFQYCNSADMVLLQYCWVIIRNCRNIFHCVWAEATPAAHMCVALPSSRLR